MACMEHQCVCGHQWFDNKAAPPCPSCGSTLVSHYFDEPLDDFYDDEPRED